MKKQFIFIVLSILIYEIIPSQFFRTKFRLLNNRVARKTISALGSCSILYVLTPREDANRFAKPDVKSIYERNETIRLAKKIINDPNLKKEEISNLISLLRFHQNQINFIANYINSEAYALDQSANPTHPESDTMGQCAKIFFKKEKDLEALIAELEKRN